VFRVDSATLPLRAERPTTDNVRVTRHPPATAMIGTQDFPRALAERLGDLAFVERIGLMSRALTDSMLLRVE
jgi:hypothetical protein